MSVDSVSFCLVIDPIPYIDISVSMDEPSLSISLISLPITFVGAAINPYLHPSAISHVLSHIPLPYVLSSVLLHIDRSLFSLYSVLRVLVIVELSDLALDVLWLVRL